jgi:hypothetical protein
VHIASLRVLDAFSPEIADGQRQLAEALATRVDAIVSRGHDDLESGNLAQAERAFRSVLDLDPRNVTARGNLAYIRRLRSTTAPRSTPMPGTSGPAATWHRCAARSRRRCRCCSRPAGATTSAKT